MRKDLFSKIFIAIFGGIGIIFLIVAVIVGIVMGGKKSHMVPADAVVTEIKVLHSGNDTTHKVFVDYEYDGHLFTHEHLGYYSSGMHEGSYIEILVDPDNPSDFMYGSAPTIIVLVFSIIGVAFTIVGASFLIYLINLKKTRRRLFHEGNRLYGRIEGFEYNLHVTINNRHPRYPVVVVEDAYTGEKTSYKGDDMSEKEISALQIGDDAIVYVDRENPSTYFVDVTGANSVMGSAMSEYY